MNQELFGSQKHKGGKDIFKNNWIMVFDGQSQWQTS
jgi:hypothetical protein